MQRGSIPLEPGHPLQIIPRQRAAGQPPTWTGQGLVRVQDGAGLRFVVDNLPSSTDYQLVIRYEPEVRRFRGGGVWDPVLAKLVPPAGAV